MGEPKEVSKKLICPTKDCKSDEFLLTKGTAELYIVDSNYAVIKTLMAPSVTKIYKCKKCHEDIVVYKK